MAGVLLGQDRLECPDLVGQFEQVIRGGDRQQPEQFGAGPRPEFIVAEADDASGIDVESVRVADGGLPGLLDGGFGGVGQRAGGQGDAVSEGGEGLQELAAVHAGTPFIRSSATPSSRSSGLTGVIQSSGCSTSISPGSMKRKPPVAGMSTM